VTTITVQGTGTSSGPTQIWRKAWGPGIIANLDLTQTIWYAPETPVTAQSDSMPALGAVGVDGSRDLWASTLSSATAVVQSMPGATSWAPSPAQISASLNALGLATEATQLAVAGNTGTVAANTAGVATVATNTTGLPGMVANTAVVATNTITTATNTTGVAKSVDITGQSASLVASGIPPYLPNAAAYGYGYVGAGNTQTLVSWSTGTKRVWSTYITLAGTSNDSFTGIGDMTAWISDGSGNIYASATLRFGAESQGLSVAVPFDALGIMLAGPNSLTINVSAAVTDIVVGADGGVMVST